jgi:predicted ATPase/class 3 adenylate cyclase
MSEFPTGTVTFLFTDIEGSTDLARRLGDRWPGVLGEHHEIVRRAIGDHDGVEALNEGDAFFAVFALAADAVAATADAQRALAAHEWPPGGAVRVRMGLHTGEGRLAGGAYVGLDVHQAARIAAVGHGGQILVSHATRALTADKLPSGLTFRDLGEHRLRSFPVPQRLLQLVIDGLPADFPPLQTLGARANLPMPLSSFVGRGREVQELRELIGATRLLTLTGPGGTGKTRLALRLAGEMAEEFRDGVFFVDLSAITDAALVAPAIAQAVGVPEEVERPRLESLAAYLAERSSLLLLDNFEQVLSAAPAVEHLLTSARGVRVLCTSREPLHLPGERQYPVPPLGMPDLARPTEPADVASIESVSLFVSRAQAVRQDFTLTADNASSVAEICTRLDGLPLAIELAASQARVLGPRSILARLRTHVPALTSPAVTVPSRQRTLHDAIGWSYDLLAEQEQTFFARVSVFSGGWTLQAADAVVNPSAELGVDTLQVMASLVDKSLVQVTGTELDEPRFTMLETIREFAVARRVEHDPGGILQRRHAEHFLAVAERAEPHLESMEQASWLDACERDHDNFRAALRWAIGAGETEIGQRIAVALWRFWYQHGHLAEGAAWFDEVLALPGPPNPPRTRAHLAAGSIAYWRGDMAASRHHDEQALAMARNLGDRAIELHALFNSAFNPLIAGDYETAMARWERAADIANEIGDRAMAARAAQSIGFALLLSGQPAAAIPVLEDVQPEWKQLGNSLQVAETAAAIATARHRSGDTEAATDLYRESLRMIHEVGNLPLTAAGLDGLAGLASSQGLYERAVRLSGAAAALKERIGGSQPMRGLWEEADIAAARAAIGDEAVAAALAEGRAMTVDQALAYALGDS